LFRIVTDIWTGLLFTPIIEPIIAVIPNFTIVVTISSNFAAIISYHVAFDSSTHR